MEIPKPSEADKERFRSLVPDDPRVEVKPMFGNLAAFVEGNMFMGLFGENVGLRLPETEREELLGADGGGPFGPEDRPIREYATLPASWMGTPESERWIRRAMEHAASLPPSRR